MLLTEKKGCVKVKIAHDKNSNENKEKESLYDVNKIIKVSEYFTTFLGVIHLVIVYTNWLFPDLLRIEMDSVRGSIMGILLLWLSLGVRKRNSFVAIIILIAWGVDTGIKAILNSGIASGPLITRSAIAIGLLVSVVGCLKFRAILKSSENISFTNGIIRSIPKIEHARITAFSILTVVGLGAVMIALTCI